VAIFTALTHGRRAVVSRVVHIETRSYEPDIGRSLPDCRRQGDEKDSGVMARLLGSRYLGNPRSELSQSQVLL